MFTWLSIILFVCVLGYSDTVDDTLLHLFEYPTNIHVNLFLKSLADVDEASEEVTFVFFIEISRRDPRVAEAIFQNASKFSIFTGIPECILLPSNRFWKASDLRFQGDTVKEVRIHGESREILVCPDGSLLETRLVEVTVNAQFDVTQFPMDEQAAFLVWGHDFVGEPYFNYSTDVRDLDFIINAGYTLNSPADWSVTAFNCGVHKAPFKGNSRAYNYTGIGCRVDFRRDPGYILTLFCVPISAIAATAVIGILATTNPLETTPFNHVFQLAIMGLMTLTVMLMAVRGHLPPSNYPHRFAKFLIGSGVIVVAAPMYTLVTRKILHLKSEWNRWVRISYAAFLLLETGSFLFVNAWFYLHLF